MNKGDIIVKTFTSDPPLTYRVKNIIWRLNTLWFFFYIKNQIISLILVPWYPFIKNEDYYIHFNMIRDEDGSIKLTPSHPILLSVQPIQFRDFSLSGITIWCPTLSRFWCKIARWRYLLQQSSSTFKLIQDFFNLDRNI